LSVCFVACERDVFREKGKAIVALWMMVVKVEVFRFGLSVFGLLS